MGEWKVVNFEVVPSSLGGGWADRVSTQDLDTRATVRSCGGSVTFSTGSTYTTARSFRVLGVGLSVGSD